MKFPERYYPFLLLVVCIFIYLPHLGTLPVNIMEARNFITAREMLDNQHWIMTTLNGEPRYEKPPLPTWLTAVSGALFGLHHTAALRFPAVLMALLLAFTGYQFGKRLTSSAWYALISMLIMVTSFYILWAGRNGQWDIFTHAFMMVAIYQFYLFFTARDNLYRHALLAGLFLGFSFMSKGPVSWYALFLPFLIAFGWVYHFGKTKDKSPVNRIIPFVVFILITVITSGWWHLYIYLHDTRAAQEITSEEVANWNSYNLRPFYYYWNFFIQSGTWSIIALVSLAYPYLKNRVFDRKAYTFTLLWTLSAVVLLSLIPEKKPRYLLPVLIPLAMNMGFYMEYLFRSFREKMSTVEKIPVWVHFGLIAIVGIAVPAAGYWYLKDHLAGYGVWFILLSFSLFGTGTGILAALRKWHIRRAFFLTIGFMCAITLFGLPLSNSFSDNPGYKSMSELAVWQDSTGLPVFEFMEASPELIWAYGKPIPVLYQKGHFKIPDKSQFGLLVSEKTEENMRSVFKDYSIQKIERYDMNLRSKAHGGHKDRLYRDLYLLTKR